MRLASFLFALSLSVVAFGSDHDDGEIDLKGRSLNLTDLYAFRESNQSGLTTDAGDLILIMNTNPRSLPGQQYFFSTQAEYSFHITRVASKTARPTGKEDIRISFKFQPPNENNVQPFSVTMIKDPSLATKKTFTASKTNNGNMIATTSIAKSKEDDLRVNFFKLDGRGMMVFAGLREDPFFFDVEKFFSVRADLAAGKPFTGFSPPNKARDFTKNYNVNTIVLRVPAEFLEKNNSGPVFDIWETISVNGKQIERLGRPAINEGLVLSNKSLNAFNSVKPTQDLSATDVLAEAGAVLGILARTGGQPADHVTKVVNGFLPDVLRLDVSKDIPVGSVGYAGDFVINDLGAPMLTGGRKIEDDVIDITLTYLVFGADGLLGSDPTKKLGDNVSYAGVAGNISQGHSLLYQQTEHGGPAKFPFLAKPY